MCVTYCWRLYGAILFSQLFSEIYNAHLLETKWRRNRYREEISYNQTRVMRGRRGEFQENQRVGNSGVTNVRKFRRRLERR